MKKPKSGVGGEDREDKKKMKNAYPHVKARSIWNLFGLTIHTIKEYVIDYF